MCCQYHTSRLGVDCGGLLMVYRYGVSRLFVVILGVSIGGQQNVV